MFPEPLVFLFSLLACLAAPSSVASVRESSPTDWYYSGEGLDPLSIRFVGPDVVFRTHGDLATGAVAGSAWLSCGRETRATLLFEGGVLSDIVTIPEAPCVEASARSLDWSGLPLDGTPLSATAHTILVYEVPAHPGDEERAS